jgi:uncharacterized protein
MAVRKGKMDKRNIVIAVLSLVVCVETYLLYKADPDRFTGFFVKRQSVSRQAAVAKKPVKVALPAEKKVLPAEQPQAPVPAFMNMGRGPVAKVAFVIDDWGYSAKNCQYLRDIKSPMTVAVLPNLEHSLEVIDCAHKAGKEVMLHLPMEPHSNPDQYPEDYILKTTMLPTKVDRLLSDILDKMPHVDGVNNHMGSKATEDRRLMTTVFRQLKHRKLFFVDSKTASKSVCASLAKEMNLPFASRDVFLDNVNERGAIVEQINVLARVAKKKGRAVAIGHDRSLTLQVIQERIAWLKEQGIEIVTVKEIIGQ